MGWVALAYGVIWLGLAAYGLRLAAATRRLEREVERLAERLPEEEKAGEPGATAAPRPPRRGG
ncbi:MAG: CcmD family protein [Clostridia bacterium]|nr:CcmD family protein [Clostridia bacterium]MCL6521780.1 CcmD family protein [Bacillota bacterium]